MTKSIGKGIVNVPVPMIEAESGIWGKLALTTDKAKAALIREAALIGLLQMAPELASEIKKLRLARKLQVASLGLLFLFGLHASFGHESVRRVSTSVRVVRRSDKAQ